jgi:hypothetical protein
MVLGGARQRRTARQTDVDEQCPLILVGQKASRQAIQHPAPRPTPISDDQQPGHRGAARNQRDHRT